jgi:HlyD family secretion protein/epimerase transport system membrane fusion protein
MSTEVARIRATNVVRLTRSADPPHLHSRDELKSRLRGPARVGHGLIAAFVAIFGIWASAVPLSGGALAPGLISPDGNRKTIQHLEGGVIAELPVRDGDLVRAGQTLIVLQSVQQRASFEALLASERSLKARLARLEAEKANADQIDFPSELLGTEPAPLEFFWEGNQIVGRAAAGHISPLVASQIQMFETRRASFRSKQRLLRQKINQLAAKIKGYVVQLASTSDERRFIGEELGAKEILAAKGFMAKPEVFRLKRADAELAATEGRFQADIAHAEEEISEAKLKIEAAAAERDEQIDAELDKVRLDLAEASEKVKASEDVLSRTVITAPVDGTVVNLKFKTKGGVIERGEPIMEIVPLHDTLLIDARVTPVDVRLVHPGLNAQIRFSAYSSRTAPRIAGKVRSISADRLTDPHNHQAYYLARVEIDREELKRRAPKVELIPGMPADVMIVTEQRTMMSYLLEPFLDALARSFREVY